MSALDKVAARYAKAFSELSVKPAEKKKLAEELSAVAGLMEGHSDLAFALTSELFSHEERRAVLKDLEGRLGLSETASRALSLLSEAKRLRALSAISAGLKELLLRGEGIVPLRVESRDELSAPERKQVEKVFQQYFGKEVEASYAVDPRLLGGVRVTAEGRTFDGTLATGLSVMKENLVGGV